MKYLEIIRIALIFIAALAVFLLGIANASGHNIPLKTDLIFISIAVVASFFVLRINSIQKKVYDRLRK
jgi:hypothetical protein